MNKLYNLLLGLLLFFGIIITGNKFTGSVVQKPDTVRFSFTWINILFFFLVMVFILWLINYVKKGDIYKKSSKRTSG
ncbi:hypothetical protein J4471_05540 [Candidatus Woesearchaeota archaeon]|nr:hypothetical protein [Candidatus Woesearchaeota archaeon]